MKPNSPGAALLVVAAFLAGFLAHSLYRRWTAPGPEGRVHPVIFSPLPSPPPRQIELPVAMARDIEKIRGLAGNQARVRGRIYRVGHSAKSNTYFLNFGPSRSSFTGVIFASALESFQKRGINPTSYEGKEVELRGEIKDDPKYGLEMILEDPGQVEILN